MKRLLIIAYLSLFLSGCVTTKVYDLAVPPINLTKETDRFYALGAYGTNGFSINAGAVLKPPFQVAGSITMNRTKGNSEEPHGSILDDYKNSYSSDVYEIMAGAFFPIDQEGVFEIFAGTGKGRGEDYTYNGELWNGKSTVLLKSSKGDYDKYFLQVNIGGRKEKFVYGMAFRANQITFTNYERWHSKRGLEFKGVPEGLIWEGTVFGRLGGDVLKLGFSATYAYSQQTLDFYYSSFSAAFVMYLSF